MMRSQRLINFVTGRIKWRWNQPVYTRILDTLVDPGRIRPSGRCLLVQANSQCQQIGRSKDYKPMIQKMQWANQLVKTVVMNPQNWISRRSLFPAIFERSKNLFGQSQQDGRLPQHPRATPESCQRPSRVKRRYEHAPQRGR